MEDKTKQKEDQFKLEVQLQREKLEFKKEQFYLKEKKRIQREGRYYHYFFSFLAFARFL
jgi:hypothetical protein